MKRFVLEGVLDLLLQLSAVLARELDLDLDVLELRLRNLLAEDLPEGGQW